MHGLRMKRLRAAALTAGLCCAGSASAGIAPPHMGEYGKSIPGSSAAFMGFAVTRGNRYYGADGAELGVAGSNTSIEAVSAGMAWTDNWFSGTSVPFLNSRAQSCGFAVSAAHIQADSASAQLLHELGLNAGANQIGNPSFGCSVQDHTRRIGPVKAHIQFGTSVQVPIGGFETDNLYNVGTRYWTVTPQLALHAEWDRLVLDGAFAYQFNSRASEVATLGLTPTRPANWRGAAVNIGMRLTPRWMADIGYAYNASVGSNQYDEVDVANQEPIGPGSICGPAGLPASICNANSIYYYQSRPGPYSDSGAMVRLASASVYYIYRSSMFVVFRASRTLSGRSGEFDANYDLCIEKPCGPANAISQFSGPTTTAAIGSGTVYELSLVFPVGAP